MVSRHTAPDGIIWTRIRFSEIEKMKNEVQTLKDQLEEIQYDKESHIECARNCADFAVKYYELRDMIDKIKEIHKEWSNDNDSDYPYWKRLQLILGEDKLG